MWDELKGVKNIYLGLDIVFIVFVLLVILEFCCCGGLEFWFLFFVANGFCVEDFGLICGELRLLNCEDDGDMIGGLFICSFLFMIGVEGWVDGLAVGWEFVDFLFLEIELVWLVGVVRVCEGRLVRDFVLDLVCFVVILIIWRLVLELIWLVIVIETFFWEERWFFFVRFLLESGGLVLINFRLFFNMLIIFVCWEFCLILVWKGILSFGIRFYGFGVMCL